MRHVRAVIALLIVATSASDALAHDPSAWGGIFRSRDNGESWLPGDAGLFIGGAMALAISPVDPNHLLYATDTRLLRSRNGGRDWTAEATEKLIGPTLSVAFHQDGRGAVASSSAGIFWTADGTAWDVSAAPTGAAPARAILAGAAAGHFYLAGPRGVFSSRDAGRTFARLGDGLPDTTPSALAVIPGTPDFVSAVLDGMLWISADGGATWRQSRTGLPDGTVDALDGHSGDTLWAFARDQLFASADVGISWRAVGNPLPERGALARGLSVNSDGRVIVLTTHRGVLRSADGGKTWAVVEGVLPTHLESGPVLRDPHDGATLYAGFALTPYAEIFRRAEQGNNLLSQIDPVSLAGGVAFLLLIAIAGVWLARKLARSYRPRQPNGRP